MAGRTRHPPTYFPSLLRVALGMHRVRFVSHWHALRVGVAVMARQLSYIGAISASIAVFNLLPVVGLDGHYTLHVITPPRARALSCTHPCSTASLTRMPCACLLHACLVLWASAGNVGHSQCKERAAAGSKRGKRMARTVCQGNQLVTSRVPRLQRLTPLNTLISSSQAIVPVRGANK